MAISSGTRLGSYELLGQIGAGGMGEVYQAHDTKLGRDVAIKILPEAFAHDADRLARFQREAKMLAALNHPNIATIYGLEQSNGTHFLIMELVSGETLAERIKRDGAFPIEEALKIAVQIAEALEAAHEKGIIHRDLKPANVKVTPEGKVKVLDFGLAKAFAGDVTDSNPSQSPTLSAVATMQGVLLGTAAYMSPEQARGKTVDKRTDIWAFGCVLYEMLTGKRAFEGEDITEILAAVVKTEPDWIRLPEATPPNIRMLLRRCLRKDRRQRLGDAGAVRIEIEDVLSGTTSAGSAPVAQPQRTFGWIAAALLLLALVGVSFVHFREVPAAAPEMRTEIATPATYDMLSFALSPDGRQIVFVASGDGAQRLWLRRLDATSAQPLAGTDGASTPFWSPDSQSVGFFAGSKLKRVDIGGGSPLTLADAANRGGAWGPDGTILFARTTGSPLFRISASGGEPLEVTKLDRQNSHRFPKFLPGGRQFLFYAQGTPETAGIYIGSLGSSETKRLAAADTAGVYAPDGWLLFIRAGTLMAQWLDLGRGELTGDSVTVADPVTFDAVTSVGAFSASAAGLVAYRSGGAGQRQLVWFDRSGTTLGTMGAPDANSLQGPRLSPDGRRVAAWRTVRGNGDIWIVDTTRTTRFTFDVSNDYYPIWSPDGSRIVFDSNRKGHRDLYLKPSNGAGNEELLVESAQDKSASDWSHDGRFLVYSSLDPQTTYDLWVLPMEGDRKPFVFLKTKFDERRAVFSPDGRWVAYMSNESGQYEIYVRPFSGTSGTASGGPQQVSTSGGVSPRWRADSKELYYIAPDSKLMAVPIAARGATIEPGTPVVVFQTRIYDGGTGTSTGTNYDVSGDGRFLINTVLEGDASPITLLQNWAPGLKK